MIRKIALFSLIGFMLSLIQIGILPELFGTKVIPNLIIAFSYSFFYLNKEDHAFLFALIGGLFVDSMGVSTVGYSALVVISFLLIFSYIKKYLFRGWFIDTLSIVATVFLYNLFINPHILSSYYILFISCFLTFIVSLFFKKAAGALIKHED